MALAGVHISGSSSPDRNNLPSTSKMIDVESLHSKLDDMSNMKNGKKSEVNEIIFNSSIKQSPVEDRLGKEVDENFEIDSDEIRLLPERRERAVTDPVSTHKNISGNQKGCVNGRLFKIKFRMLLASLLLTYIFMSNICIMYSPFHKIKQILVWSMEH